MSNAHSHKTILYESPCWFILIVCYISQDKKLTVDEVIDNSDLFVGSQATDFGNYLYRHDEF